MCPHRAGPSNRAGHPAAGSSRTRGTCRCAYGRQRPAASCSPVAAPLDLVPGIHTIGAVRRCGGARSAGQLTPPEALDLVVVDESGRLHERVADRRTNEVEAAALE